jgi:alkylmercury lyase
MEDRLDKILDTLLEVRAPFAAAEQELSLTLYRRLTLGEPVAPEAVARAAGVDRVSVDAALSRAPGVQRDDQGRVTGYWGLTITETPHRMLVDGRRVYTWCAWDTLFLPELLGSAAQVESSCPVTGARIALEVGPQGAVSDGTPPPVSFIMPDPRKAAADIVRSFCHFVFFLASDAAAREWSAAHPGTVIATLEEAWELGRRRNARCYPGREFGFARASAQATLRSTTAASRPA